MSDASAPQNNQHHAGGYRSEDDFLDDVLGRGAGDGDVYPIPGQDDNEPEITGQE